MSARYRRSQCAAISFAWMSWVSWAVEEVSFGLETGSGFRCRFGFGHTGFIKNPPFVVVTNNKEHSLNGWWQNTEKNNVKTRKKWKRNEHTPPNCREKRSCWTNKLHTANEWATRTAKERQSPTSKGLRGPGFYTTIIPFYLVLYYSTVPANAQRPPFIPIYIYIFLHALTFACLSLSFSVPHPVPTATILGGPDLHVDKGSTINLTCTVKFSPEPPAYIFWYHHEEVIKAYCYFTVPQNWPLEVRSSQLLEKIKFI